MKPKKEDVLKELPAHARKVVSADFWRGGLLLTNKGEPKRCLANVMHVFSLHPEWTGVLAFDAFGLAVVTCKRPPMRAHDAPQDYAIGDWTDEDSARTVAWFASEVGFEPGVQQVDQAVAAIARKRTVHGVKDYARAARGFRKAHITTLARSVGGGHCGPAPASIIASAALQFAASRFAFEVLGDMTLGSRLANDSRQNLLAAHELCAREAQARPRPVAPWLGPPVGTIPHNPEKP